jgi:branched-chain amino acid aminotransferase
VPTRVNINGEISHPEEARISIFDHGFLYGDSIYESFRTYRKRAILFERNFARLERAATSVSLEVPWDEETLKAEVYRTIDAAANEEESLVRIIVTRGEGDLTPDPGSCANPSIVIIVLPLSAPADNLYRDGVAIIFSSLKRDSHIASIKTGNLIHQVLGAQEARGKDAVEAIFLTPDGYVSDGTRSNIYFVVEDEVMTPPTEVGIIAGITRSLVLEIASDMGIKIQVEKFVPSDVGNADESFITSTTRGILPVTRIDGNEVGTGKVGPITTRLMTAFRRAVESLAEKEQIG